jgi:hypothetical protein
MDAEGKRSIEIQGEDERGLCVWTPQGDQAYLVLSSWVPAGSCVQEWGWEQLE